MTWLEIFGWFFAFTIATSLFYKKGVKAGIRHSLLTLDLEQDQVQILGNELNSKDLAMNLMKNETWPKRKDDIKYN